VILILFTTLTDYPFIEIGADLSREVNVTLKKRRLSKSSLSPSNEKKKHKPAKHSTGASNSSGPRNNLGASVGTSARPKRGVQQLLYQNMPYVERPDVGRNPVGNPVRYSNNLDFKPKLIKTDEVRRVCAGQAFAKYLTENNSAEWIVRKSKDKYGNWDYVAYKDCNRCNSKEQGAVEGKNKFSGYDALAKFVLSKTGLKNELIKKSEEIVDLFKMVGLSCKIDNKVMQQRATTTAASSACNSTANNLATPRPVKAAPRAAENAPMTATNNGNQNQATRSVENNTTTTPAAAAAITGAAPNDTRDPSSLNHMDFYFEKKEELVKAMKIVQEKLDNARSSFLGDEHIWKHDKSIDFYNTLQRSIKSYSKSSSAIRSFEFSNMQRMLDSFDKDMADLTRAEEHDNENYIEFCQGIIESSIEVAKELFLPKPN
jgi:hypothetical protein